MLGHLRRSSQRLQIANLAVYSTQSPHIEYIAGWCRNHSTRNFSVETSNRVSNDRGYQSRELKPSLMKDDVAIIERIKNSTKELRQGPVGKNLSSAEKRKFLVNTLLDLEDSKEGVYSTLDAWVAFEREFPVASLKQALVALEKEEQWHRIVQVIKWMLSKGQGKTIRTYEQLVCALEKDNRADEACRIWELKIAHDLQSVPWRFCRLMLGIYYRNNRLDTLVKLFKNLEACGRKPPSKDIVRKVEDTYEMLGLVEEKKELLEKYKELFDKPSNPRVASNLIQRKTKNMATAEEEEKVPSAKKMKMTEDEVLLAYPSREEEDGKRRKKVVKRLGKEEVERLLSVTVTVPTLSDHDDDDEEEDVWVREVLLRANRSLRASAMNMRQAQDLIRSLFEAKGYVDVLAEVDDDDDDEMHLEEEGGEEAGKEEVERLLSLKLAVPTLSEEVMSMPDDDEEDVWVREVLLRANRSLRASAMSMRQAQDLIRSLFEAKGYVDVLDEVSDDDEMMEM
uniref:Pentacotripeptide-repeat region of PRORP domain-containing protein n=2 Tax=Oryza punctata TaxID=4537 RepID=A0A0E0MBW7_ORYPU